MKSSAISIKHYLETLEGDRLDAVTRLHQIIIDNLSGKYSANMQYGMISYTIPHSVYPAGYHCKPSDDVPYISIASQKNYISLYHLGLYDTAELLDWLNNEFSKAGIKLDMGKCCIRFKKIDQIPYDIITGLIKKSSTARYLEHYKTIDPRNK